MSRRQIAVIGGAQCSALEEQWAYEVGAEIAKADVALICGGREGVMEAASLGAKDHGGLTIGLLPGGNVTASPPNSSIDVALFTDMGQARNAIVVQSAAAVIAVGGGWGTLSEIALARKAEIPVILLASWNLTSSGTTPEQDLIVAEDAAEAVRMALTAARWDRLN